MLCELQFHFCLSMSSVMQQDLSCRNSLLNNGTVCRTRPKIIANRMNLSAATYHGPTHTHCESTHCQPEVEGEDTWTRPLRKRSPDGFPPTQMSQAFSNDHGHSHALACTRYDAFSFKHLLLLKAESPYKSGWAMDLECLPLTPASQPLISQIQKPWVCSTHSLHLKKCHTAANAAV
jgi:hypothetical protein